MDKIARLLAAGWTWELVPCYGCGKHERMLVPPRGPMFGPAPPRTAEEHAGARTTGGWRDGEQSDNLDARRV